MDLNSHFPFPSNFVATMNSYCEHFLPHHYIKRTDSDHEDHCTEIQGPLQEHYSKTYGVNRRSKLVNVTNFSLCNGGLPHHFMHDILEGVAQLEIKLLVRHCVDMKYFALDE